MSGSINMNLAQRRRSGCLRHLAWRAQPLVRLVCFPWAGAGASAYRKLAAALPEHMELLAVQLPCREDRLAEPGLPRMEQLVAHVLGDIISVFDRPLVFFGHSMGALLAYETARALRAHTGREPDALVVSGQVPPDFPDASRRSWHSAGDEEFIEHIRQLGGTPEAVLADRQMMRTLLPALRADYAVLEHYAHAPAAPFAGPLIACAGRDDPDVSEAGMAAWGRHTRGRQRVHWFEGDHFYLCGQSQAQALADCLQQWLEPA